MEKVKAIWTWIKSNPLSVVAGTLTTIFGLVVGASNAVPIALKALDLPDCLTYADVYHDSWSDFKRESMFWREYPHGSVSYSYEFREEHRTRDNIDLLNLTARPEEPGWKTMIVRLPVCGGTARITVGIVQNWKNLYEVWRD